MRCKKGHHSTRTSGPALVGDLSWERGGKRHSVKIMVVGTKKLTLIS